MSEQNNSTVFFSKIFLLLILICISSIFLIFIFSRLYNLSASDAILQIALVISMLLFIFYKILIKEHNKIVRHFNAELQKQEIIAQRNQDLLQYTEEIANVGCWYFDGITNKLTWSDKLYKMLEIENKNIPLDGEYAMSFYAPEYRAKIDQAVERMTMCGESYNMDAQIITAKKNRIWVSLISHAIKENHENPHAIKAFGVIQNISNKKQEEIAFSIKSQQFDILLQYINDGIIITDASKNILCMNNSTQTITGYNDKDLVGKNICSVFNFNDDDEKFKQAILIFKNGESHKTEYISEAIKYDNNIISYIFIFKIISQHLKNVFSN